MAKWARAERMYVPWDADALADALFKTEDEAEACVLARTLVIKLIDDAKADEAKAKYLNENKAKAQAQEKALTEGLMRQWMRSQRTLRQ